MYKLAHQANVSVKCNMCLCVCVCVNILAVGAMSFLQFGFIYLFTLICLSPMPLKNAINVCSTYTYTFHTIQMKGRKTVGQLRCLAPQMRSLTLFIFLGRISSHMQDSWYCWWTWTSVNLQLNWQRSYDSNRAWRTRRGKTEVHLERENISLFDWGRGMTLTLHWKPKSRSN